jgi:hypothetical protein
VQSVMFSSSLLLECVPDNMLRIGKVTQFIHMPMCSLNVRHSSVFINTVLVLWAFRLTLDRTKPLDDAAFMNGTLPNEQPCTIDFQTRIPEAELRRIMGRDIGDT